MEQSILQILIFIITSLSTAMICINLFLKWNEKSGVFTKLQEKAKNLKYATAVRLGGMMAFAFVLITIFTAIQNVFPNPYLLYASLGIILGALMAFDNIVFKGEELAQQRKKSKGKANIIHRDNNIYKKKKKKRKKQ